MLAGIDRSGATICVAMQGTPPPKTGYTGRQLNEIMPAGLSEL